jgi:hypothetical protein
LRTSSARSSANAPLPRSTTGLFPPGSPRSDRRAADDSAPRIRRLIAHTGRAAALSAPSGSPPQNPQNPQKAVSTPPADGCPGHEVSAGCPAWRRGTPVAAAARWVFVQVTGLRGILWQYAGTWSRGQHPADQRREGSAGSADSATHVATRSCSQVRCPRGARLATSQRRSTRHRRIVRPILAKRQGNPRTCWR